MKTTKASKTNTRSRIIFFAIALTYNLLLGLYLKDFLAILPMLVTLYLLSALPTLFFVPKIRSTQDHTWNRVYYDGFWWDMDATNDISCTASGKSPYGFRELTSVYDSDKDYYITNIY